MRRIIAIVVCMVISYLLQSTLLASLPFSLSTPNLLLILAVTAGILRGRKEGMVVGFFCGLLMDIFYGSVMGFYALVYLCIGALNGFLHEKFPREQLKLSMLLFASGDLLYHVMVWGGLFLLRGQLKLGYYLIHIMLPELVITVLFAFPIYALYLRVNDSLEKREKRRNRSLV